MNKPVNVWSLVGGALAAGAVSGVVFGLVVSQALKALL